MKSRLRFPALFYTLLLLPLASCNWVSPEHYLQKGTDKLDQGDLSGAISAFDQAVMLDPSNSMVYAYRGWARQANGDIKGAIEDFDEALSIDPRDANSYTGRGFAKRFQGDMEGAIADYNKAITLYSGDSFPLGNLGLAQQDKNDLKNAISNYRKAIELHTDSEDYTQFFLWSALVQQNQKAQANTELSAYLAQRPASVEEWPVNIGKFLLGQISEADLLAAAPSSDSWKNQGNFCEAWYYIGMNRLQAGDKSSAKEAFQKSINANRKDFVEYVESQFQIKRLN